MNTQQQNPFSFDGGSGGNDDGEGSSSNSNALILSLYLIHSQDDLLDSTTTNTNDGDAGVKQQRAARLYQRLCEACAIANNILVQSSYSLDGGDDDVSPPAAKKYHPWSSGGDGPIFGIHCDTSSDDEQYATMNDMDGDDIWQQSQQQIPKNNNQSTEDELSHDAIGQQQQAEVAANNKRRVVLDDNQQQQQQQPHLRAICQYNNDINDLWRCISLAYQISTQLSSTKSSSFSSSSSSDDEDDSSSYLTCAMEVWDSNDGHILLIEGAEYLPNWVDDDITQGGVGGPRGCRNRCWIVNGKVCLIPPSLSVNRTSSSIDNDDDEDDDGKDDDVATLSRQDALRILMESNEDGEELIIDSRIIASNSVQCAIQDRINRIDYSIARSRSRSQSDKHGNKRIDKEPSNSNTQPPRHWHTAAVALPASVARFVQLQPSLVPLLVDSFCDGAPTYLKEQQSGDYAQTNDDTNASKPTTTTTISSSSFGKSFPYEQIVIIPITITRTNYAELVTGRGIVPSFPIPKSYKSVELNRFQRQLRQSTDHYMADNEDDEEIGRGTNAKMKKRSNPYTRAVDVGVRLCAGLDWIIANNNNYKKYGCGGSVQDIALEPLEDSAISTLGEVERRLRIYWTRIDAEASGIRSEENVDSSLVSPWIEQAWQAGPNGSGIQSSVSDKVLLQALESMSKCHVFNPELSQPLWKQPCPCTRPNISLHTMVQSGIKSALKWQREKYTEYSFPMPRVWEVDDDNWMEVNSLEELEEEMRSLSSRPNKARSSSSTDANVKDDKSKPRRTTRRSRRKLAQTNLKEDEKTDGFDIKPQDEDDTQPVNKVLNGIQSFVDDEGNLEGDVTKAKSSSSTEDKNCINQDDAEQLMSQEVNINPRKFLDILHARLSNQNTAEVSSNAIDQEDNISKFFFEEDLDDADMSDSSEQSNDDDLINDEDYNPQSQDEDPFSLHNIMEAMDHELRTDAVSHPSIRNLSVASEENNGGNGGSGTGDDTDLAILSNLLSSIDAHGEASGPVSNILREMGICPPPKPVEEESD